MRWDRLGGLWRFDLAANTFDFHAISGIIEEMKINGISFNAVIKVRKYICQKAQSY